MESYEQIIALFERESDRESLPLRNDDIEEFARKVSFSLNITQREHRDVLQLPNVSLPLGTDDAVKLAGQLRNLLMLNDLDPLYQLPVLMDATFGVLLFAVEQRSIAGACARIGEVPFVFVSRLSDVDGLYTCARQLGHLIALPARQKQVCFDLAHENTHSPRGSYRRFADWFALELLIPTRGLVIALKEVRELLKVSNGAVGDVELLYLSRIFGVSFLGMARRCERAGLLPEGGASILYQTLVENHGGPENRAATAMLPPRPTINLPSIPGSFALQVASQIRKGQISSKEFEDQIGLPASCLAQVLGLN